MSEKITIFVARVDDLVDYETHFADRGDEIDHWPAHRARLTSAIILSGRTSNTTFKMNFFSGVRFLSLVCQKHEY